MLSQHGTNKVNIPLHDGSQATTTGVCIDKITSTFPTYPLHGWVINDIINAYQKTGGDVKILPTIAKSVGAEIDLRRAWHKVFKKSS